VDLYSDMTSRLFSFVSTFIRCMRVCIDLAHSDELKFVNLMYPVLSLIRILYILDSLVWMLQYSQKNPNFFFALALFDF
jgi:hypothetical protein